MDVPDVPFLVWVFGFGPDDVYAVGEDGGAVYYDGNSWSRLSTGTEQDLWGVWGAAPNDLWVVGGDVGVGEPLLLHFDGATFTPVPVPENDRSATSLFKIWGIGDKVFAVGENGLIIQWTDGAWVQVPAGSAADDDFVSLWGTSEDNIVAVGGRATARIARYDGENWTTEQFGAVPGLNGVFMVHAGEAIVAGVNGYVGRFDVTTGSLEAERFSTNLSLHAVWASSAETYYAVGGRFTTPYRGVAAIRRLGDGESDPGEVPSLVRPCDISTDCPQNQVGEFDTGRAFLGSAGVDRRG
jgi:hypothetical protein